MVTASALAAVLAIGACSGAEDGAAGADSGAIEMAEPTEQSGSTPSDGSAGDVPQEYEGVIAAIATAEEDAGGQAFELDDGDGGTWEVHVAVGADDIEVLVSADGSEVLESDREADLGSTDAAGLDATAITLSDALRLAITEYGGTEAIDDAGISDEGGGEYAWEVAFMDDVEVYLTMDGEILRVETD